MGAVRRSARGEGDIYVNIMNIVILGQNRLEKKSGFKRKGENSAANIRLKPNEEIQCAKGPAAF